MIAHGNGAEHLTIGASAVLLIAAYASLWSRQRAPARHRLGCWICGVTTLVVASTPWVESLAEESFTGHMLQHLLVIAVAAPLLVLAQPLRTAVRSGHDPADGRRAPARRSMAALRTADRARGVRACPVRQPPHVRL